MTRPRPRSTGIGSGKLAVREVAAARMLDMHHDTFKRHVAPEVRAVRISARLKIYPVAELQAWLDRNAARIDDALGFDNR